MKRVCAWVSGALLALTVCGCGSPATTAGGSGGGNGGSKGGLQVGLVFDSGGRGDKSFNDSAYNGLERANKDLGIVEHTVDSRSESDYETNLEALSES